MVVQSPLDVWLRALSCWGGLEPTLARPVVTPKLVGLITQGSRKKIPSNVEAMYASILATVWVCEVAVIVKLVLFSGPEDLPASLKGRLAGRTRGPLL